jgi:predicted  nucleic acid-binding Zn-ribbon protein
MFICLECGRKLRTARAAERAAFHGCPKCGGTDIDIDLEEGRHEALSRDAATKLAQHPAARSADGQE